MASDKNATQIADRLLAEDWSASAYVRELQNEQAAAQNILFILQDQELRKLEPLIKVRLLLAPLFLRKQERDRLKDSLQVLADKLCLDDDEWVKVTAYAVGRYEGHLDLAAVSKASRAVSALLSGASCSCMLKELIVRQTRQHVSAQYARHQTRCKLSASRWRQPYQSYKVACHQHLPRLTGHLRYATFLGTS